MRKSGTTKAVTVLAVGLLFAAWLSTPFVHAHHDDGEHSIAGNFIHAHAPAAHERHHSHTTPSVEEADEHGTPVDTFNVETFSFQHVLGDTPAEPVTIALYVSGSFERESFHRSHDPPRDCSSSPRAPPKPSV